MLNDIEIVEHGIGWCPEVDCTSGPVQKVTQHLQLMDSRGTTLDDYKIMDSESTYFS